LIDNPPLDVQEFVLPPGSTFVMYTDGVIDAIDEEKAPFGRMRLLEKVERGLALGAQELCNAVVQSVLAYHGIMPQFDDVTVVAVHVE
jgi:serine phosphatase RsbU (regulator of sigma subunit)